MEAGESTPASVVQMQRRPVALFSIFGAEGGMGFEGGGFWVETSDGGGEQDQSDTVCHATAAAPTTSAETQKGASVEIE